MNNYKENQEELTKESNSKKLGLQNIKGRPLWLAVVILSLLTIIVGNQIATNNFKIFDSADGSTVKAKVIKVLDSSVIEQKIEGQDSIINKSISFTCKIESGPHKGKSVIVEQTIDSINAYSIFMKEVEAGDMVMLFSGNPEGSDPYSWEFADYYRLDKIIILGLVFAAMIILLGGRKGVNTLLSLCFTFTYIFMVFVPSVMNGYNAYASAALTCSFTIIMTLILINGASKKTLATIIGCISGTVIAAVTTAIMSSTLRLTGFVDEHSIYLTMMNPDKPIDLTAIIFAAILIGALGAIMDVAMDLASALYELCDHAPEMTFKKLFRSGMRIGSDIMGTMANTLVLAYIGSSLAGIMLFLTYSSSAMDLLNREAIIVELLQALAGSLAILFTIPFTVIICGFLYLKQGKPAADSSLRQSED